MQRRILTAVTVAGLALTAACAPATGTAAPTAALTTEPTGVPTAAASPTAPEATAAVQPLPTYGPASPAVEAAIAQAASQSGAAASAVEVSRVEPVDWPDASLGCPQPGGLYAQVITPGWLVVVQAAGTTYEFHADASGQNVVLCQQ